MASYGAIFGQFVAFICHAKTPGSIPPSSLFLFFDFVLPKQKHKQKREVLPRLELGLQGSKPLGAKQLHYRTVTVERTKKPPNAQPTTIIVNREVKKYKSDPRGNRTPNLRVWNPTRYHCAMESSHCTKTTCCVERSSLHRLHLAKFEPTRENNKERAGGNKKPDQFFGLLAKRRKNWREAAS